jgi:hypothetical protein
MEGMSSRVVQGCQNRGPDLNQRSVGNKGYADYLFIAPAKKKDLLIPGGEPVQKILLFKRFRNVR